MFRLTTVARKIAKRGEVHLSHVSLSLRNFVVISRGRTVSDAKIFHPTYSSLFSYFLDTIRLGESNLAQQWGKIDGNYLPPRLISVLINFSNQPFLSPKVFNIVSGPFSSSLAASAVSPTFPFVANLLSALCRKQFRGPRFHL